MIGPMACHARSILILATALLSLVATACRSVPTAGTGDVAFRLVWSGQSDLDLHVQDPAGEGIFFGHRSSATGGILDVDCNSGTDRMCERPIENVYWPIGTAPEGRYLVWVRAHAVVPAEAPVDAELQILEGERVVVRRRGVLLANGDRVGPFAVDFPPDEVTGWRIGQADPEEALHGSSTAFICEDGFEFEVRYTGEGVYLILPGGPTLLEIRTGGMGSRDGTVFLLQSDEGTRLVTPSGSHGPCRNPMAPDGRGLPPSPPSL